MTREELLQLAKDAGAGYIDPPCGDFLTFDVDSDQLERFAALVAAREREECAKVCEETDNDPYVVLHVGTVCAAAIRARK